MISVCENCHQDFKQKRENRILRFCSNKCANIFTAQGRRRQIIIICETCAKQFTVAPSDLRYRGKIRFCSHRCSGIANMSGSFMPCAECGNKNYVAKARIKRHKMFFCDELCTFAYRRKHPNRKNGWWLENGYKVIYAGNGKGKKEHIAVMESHIGRPLKKGECVHHINHNKVDNRIENLRLMTLSEHTSMHRREKTMKDVNSARRRVVNSRVIGRKAT